MAPFNPCALEFEVSHCQTWGPCLPVGCGRLLQQGAAYGRTQCWSNTAPITHCFPVCLQSVGDRFFDEALYEAARIIFAHIPNYGRLASTLVRLHLFQPAVEAARKANSPRTWKEVGCTPGTLELCNVS